MFGLWRHQHLKTLIWIAWRQRRVAQNKQEAKKYPQPQTKEELQQWLIDFFLGSSMKIRSIRGIPAVLRICMIGRRWCSINRSVSGKLNWQLVANKQCYEYVWYVLEGVGVQADHSWRVEEQRGSMGISPGKAANSGQGWLFFFLFSSRGLSKQQGQIQLATRRD